MTDSKDWEGVYMLNREPIGNWKDINYDDTHWFVGKAAFGSKEMKRTKTEWSEENSDIWVRREFSIDSIDRDIQFFFKYSHDDAAEFYLNGELLISTGNSWNNNVLYEFSEEEKKILKKGKNVFAVHCHNSANGAYLDFGLYCKKNRIILERRQPRNL